MKDFTEYEFTDESSKKFYGIVDETIPRGPHITSFMSLYKAVSGKPVERKVS